MLNIFILIKYMIISHLDWLYELINKIQIIS